MNKTKCVFGSGLQPSRFLLCTYEGAENVVMAGSQGVLNFTRYCGKQVWWIGSKCGQTAMLALSSGGKVVESKAVM